MLRKAPASVAIRLLRDGDRAGAAEAVDAGYEQVAEALASAVARYCIGEMCGRFKYTGRRRRRRAAPIQRCWRKVAHLPQTARDAPCSWVASLCTRKVLAKRPSVRGRPGFIEAGYRFPSVECINNRRDAVPPEECLLQYRTARRRPAEGRLHFSSSSRLLRCQRAREVRQGLCHGLQSGTDLVGEARWDWSGPTPVMQGSVPRAMSHRRNSRTMRPTTCERRPSKCRARSAFAFADLCDEMLRRDRLSKDDDDEDQPTKKRRQAKEVVCDLARLAGRRQRVDRDATVRRICCGDLYQSDGARCVLRCEGHSESARFVGESSRGGLCGRFARPRKTRLPPPSRTTATSSWHYYQLTAIRTMRERKRSVKP